jgi:hypothetical protein
MWQRHFNRSRALVGSLIVVAAAFAAVNTAAPAADTTPTQAYTETLRVMAALPQPNGIDFTATVTINGAGIRLNRQEGLGALQIGVGRNFKSTDSWPASFRTAGATAVIHVADGSTLRVRSPLFKPTWNTATTWARYGFRGAAEATPTPVPVVQASAPPLDMQVIGRIQSLAATGYHIEDSAPESCAHSEHPTRHLHFTPFRDPGTHPLTDVIIEDETKRVCEMRFRVATPAAVSLTGYVRVDFGERGGYWIVTGGGGDYTLRFLGFGMKHASMSFGVLDPTFT